MMTTTSIKYSAFLLNINMEKFKQLLERASEINGNVLVKEGEHVPWASKGLIPTPGDVVTGIGKLLFGNKSNQNQGNQQQQQVQAPQQQQVQAPQQQQQQATNTIPVTFKPTSKKFFYHLSHKSHHGPVNVYLQYDISSRKLGTSTGTITQISEQEYRQGS